MRLTRWPNAAVHKTIERWPRTVSRTTDDALSNALTGYDDHDDAFAHVGLSDVNSALPGNPYESVMEVLTDHFDSILAPGFTDYFRTSGVYDRQHSRPKHGTFAKLFLEDADYRTKDACKSILVNGEYRFQGCEQRNSYAPDGCFERLRKDDVLVVSIGTTYLICSYLHHLEAKNDVPYMTPKTFDGVIHDDGEEVEIAQTTHYYDGVWSFNKLKLQRHLREHDAIDQYDLNGLQVFVTSVRDVDELVTEKLRDDPYYLVT